MSKAVSNLSHHDPDLRSYGRRRGRKRSARQDEIFETGLKRWGVSLGADQRIDLHDHFAGRYERLCLEIGFGGGEHLVWQAAEAPQTGFIGAEPFEDGVVKALTAIDECKLTNVRIWPGDTRILLRALPDAFFSQVFMLFPDPWPKKRHVKRRLFSAALLDGLSRTMKPGGELRVATDISDYACTILRAVQRHPAFCWPVLRPGDWRERTPDWPATRYEEKARCAKRSPMFFRFRHDPTGKSCF